MRIGVRQPLTLCDHSQSSTVYMLHLAVSNLSAVRGDPDSHRPLTRPAHLHPTPMDAPHVHVTVYTECRAGHTVEAELVSSWLATAQIGLAGAR